MTVQTSRAEAKPEARRRVFSHPLAHLLAALILIGLVQAFVVKLVLVPSGSMEQTLETGDRVLVDRLAYAFGDARPSNGDVVVFSTREELWPGGNHPEPASAAGWFKHGVRWVLGDLIGIGPTTDRLIVKRVIGTPGQMVECCGEHGRVMVDGREIPEPYVFEDLPFRPEELDCDTAQVSLRCFGPVAVPEGMLLVLGDHRSRSEDGVAECRGSASPQADGSGADCVRWVSEEDVIGEAFAVVWPLGRIGNVE
ncbi:signal peptidase I [Leucobacter tenebrionis]|uniref:signal peptidase I n=1 Tax=Leucobacter tenebrionis TaxID=2873270 RepID=UPI001CA693C4|nr:signal peptidase I [Leucobacter tenebrionis]QZY53053.1 signal peptidase I [Leucobacter tenebrionis]